VAGLAALVARSALVLGALSRDVALLSAVVALSDTAVSALAALAAETAGLSSTAGRAVSRDVADTAAVVARSSALVTAVAAESTSARVSLGIARLGAHSRNVARLAASVALSTAGSGSAETALGGALRASGRDVALLAARVAGLSLGGRALNVSSAW
jgi:hypothetical protein